MKTLIPAALALFAAAAPAAAAERRFMVTDFDRIRIDGPYQVSLSTGRPSAAVATGSREALDRVTIEVQGRTLHIKPNRSAWGGNPGPAGTIQIMATTRVLSSGAVTGAGSLAIDRVKGLRIDLSLAGSGRLGVAGIDTDQLIVALTGSGEIALAGKTRQLRASIQGTGDLDAKALRAEDADVGTSTAGTVSLAAVRTARVRANGTGEVAISGSPACTVSGLGAGGVRCGGR